MIRRKKPEKTQKNMNNLMKKKTKTVKLVEKLLFFFIQGLIVKIGQGQLLYFKQIQNKISIKRNLFEHPVYRN